jgi:hypothetical protein
MLFINSAVAFFFLFFLHGFSIGTRQQGILYNSQICATNINYITINELKIPILKNVGIRCYIAYGKIISINKHKQNE